MAATQHPTPPDVGKNAPVRVTRDMHDDLTVLMSTGHTLTDVIRAAVRDRADAYRAAWDYGDVPPGTAPRITGCTYESTIDAAVRNIRSVGGSDA